MSEFSIRDGTGSGHRAAVSPDGRLNTIAKVLPQVNVEAVAGNQFIFPLSRRTVTTIDTEHTVFWINPNSPTRVFVPQRFIVSVRDTTPILARLYLGGTVPSANNVVFAPGNANTLSRKAASITAHVWNGVGTGMTQTSRGTESFAAYFKQGFTDVPLEGGQVWGLNAGITISLECAGTNAVTAVITGWEAEV